ncbi:asparaginase [Verminephrobacter aporrectodeae subsp. tuberculatae]|uniref:asparaginase n=1 Tax=Verminephrobacter aporrectodeae TaxID=1110389 RepID=UPI002243FCE3|nr:asparaginase [Verminephrobacter aporrectodeae]MCW8166001.1 asparaginase [Verminephrobacter aporrectodeae subsp. tuberculatae]MCW8170647.1 asparaginase [Verminephrobacter aporrectodeae subsp. tuberculatae]
MQVSAQKIVVLGTGGTIAGTSARLGDNLDYIAAQCGVERLLAAVPALQTFAAGTLVAEQVAQIDSKDMDCDVWRALALRCAQHLQDPAVRGLVITHGTDTLEETAWFLHAVLDARKPVVLTCAMRPANALTPDGPQNLLDAVAVVQAPGASGVLAVAAGQLHGAQQVQKVHPYRVHAFSSGDAGPLGWIEEGRVRLAQAWPPAPENKSREVLEKLAHATRWPWVEVVLSHAGACGMVVDALVREGVQGLVVAGTGNGSVHHALEAALLRAQSAGVRVLRATRCPEGQVLARPGDLLPASRGLSPVKARVALMLDLL